MIACSMSLFSPSSVGPHSGLHFALGVDSIQQREKPLPLWKIFPEVKEMHMDHHYLIKSG